MGEAGWFIQIIPQQHLTEALTPGKLQAAVIVIIGVHITRIGLQPAPGGKHQYTQQKQDQISSFRHPQARLTAAEGLPGGWS